MGVGLISPLPLSLFIIAAIEKLVILFFSVAALQPEEELFLTTEVEEVTRLADVVLRAGIAFAAETAKFVEIIYFLFLKGPC